MKQTVFLIGFIFIFLSCQEEVIKSSEEIPLAFEEECTTMNNTLEENFEVEFSLDKNNAIVATITPGEGAYFASPESSAVLNGYAHLEIEENNFIHVDDGFIESPVSEKVYDSYSQGYINWVYDRTSYTYESCRKLEEDFEVGGKLSFVIEPECNRYEVRFVLTNKNGTLSIQKTTTQKNNLIN